jgi:subtilase family serine protease
VAADLAVYRSTFGLPACTAATGCFTKVNQTGGSTPPGADSSWAQEISLDVEMASAVCPNCRILLVEANSTSYSDLAVAEGYAAAHATVVSNSWGSSEFSGEASWDGSFNHPGVPTTFSTGDGGYGVQYPAASPYVTAVGGTSLVQSNAARGYSETAWPGGGSGCSAYEAKPTWQTDSGCPRRTVGDVAADADPSTGVAVYDSYASGGMSGWMIFGGTSVASPIVAGVYALAANGSSIAGGWSYGHAGSLFDVVSGSNGSCGGSYLCTAGTGYDGPTGLGTPNGSGAF